MLNKNIIWACHITSYSVSNIKFSRLRRTVLHHLLKCITLNSYFKILTPSAQCFTLAHSGKKIAQWPHKHSLVHSHSLSLAQCLFVVDVILCNFQWTSSNIQNFREMRAPFKLWSPLGAPSSAFAHPIKMRNFLEEKYFPPISSECEFFWSRLPLCECSSNSNERETS